MSLTDLFNDDSPPPSPWRKEALFLDGESASGEDESMSGDGESAISDDESTSSERPMKRQRRLYDSSPSPPPFSLAELLRSPGFQRDLQEITRAAERGRLDILDESGPPAPAPRRRLDNADGSGVPDPTPELQGIAPRVLAELFDDPLAAQDPLAAGGASEEEPKRRRVIAKVDPDRLLGPKGFPALVAAARKFKVKGKGHETSDLERLMDTYQVWAHGMFPKGEFGYTIGRIEAVCRKNQMVNAIRGLRDEFHPPPRTPSPDPEEQGSAAGSPRREEESLDAFIERGEESMGDETFRYAPGAETLAADRRPLFAPGPDVDDDEDEDELAALAEMERETGVEESTALETRRETRVDFGDEPPAFDEEEEW
ncbi:Swi3-domain-containing protein [Cutaneotrichosporon oleaginosum]|uniref:Chromosome segregation in meiosis protein n=1 Tax=Cutaneotrichosporon oleaginosum TaxID=879819 RepID=A0A0J0XS79_9TREE|nr:Swi3-domain-containing protein [Cutaneotrichosporon oleaginosum]KLT43921.1 Swi3-domain-containing protein [Cutaneotrichosporon oleaginosum]TXT04132.1 hypothetical protein COLE_07829 [Cutaneotrichosporon oleaginosum]